MEVNLAVSGPNLKCKLKAYFLGHLHFAFNAPQPAVAQDSSAMHIPAVPWVLCYWCVPCICM